MNRCSITQVRQIAQAIVLLLVAGQSVADALPDHDYGPLTGIFGFPASTEGGEIVGRGRHSWGTSLGIASHSIDETSDGEVLRFDGETTRLGITYRYGVSDQLDIGVEVPYLWHQSGNLDSLIDSWHDFFGLPEGSRPMREQDQLEFVYANSQTTLIDVTNNAHGVGDVRVLAGWKLAQTATHSTALQLGVKLATGDSDRLMGSGGTDVSLGIARDTIGVLGKANLSSFYRVNITYLGEPDRLANRFNDLVGQFSFGFGYRTDQNVDFRLQSRIRSAVYDSDIDNLGATSMSLTFGADFRLSEYNRLVLSVGEDVKSGSAPDISFQVAFRYLGK